MAVDITMPRLSDSMEEGTVAKWLVEVGAEVSKGQVLVEIDTDKATMEYEAEAAGTLLAILVGEGESAPIGAPIARIGAPDEGVAEPPGRAESPPVRERVPVITSPTERPAGSSRANASPVARRLAAERSVDLDSIRGSGPGGLITKEDVELVAAGGVAPPVTASRQGETSPKGEVRIQELTRVQRVIARRMVEGAAAPDFAVDAEIDMSAVVRLRVELAERETSVPSLNDFIVRAAAVALRDFPRLNAAYTGRGFELYSRVNVGVAVATEDGLVVPTVFDADLKSLADIAAEARSLAQRVRDGTVTPRQLEGGTFTVTNLGMFGASRFVPILNPPQAAILAVGAVTRRPVFDEEGNVVARDLVNATLVCDHRIAYGADAARFLARFRDLLESPEQIA